MKNRPWTTWDRPLISAVVVVIAYYFVPLDSQEVVGVEMLVALAALAVLAWAIITHLRRWLSGNEDTRLQSLSMLLALVVVVFAIGYYLLERSTPGEVPGIETRTDALYFTVVTLATVGYGDIHPEGQIARAFALVQIVFDLVFVAALGSVLTSGLRQRAAKRARTKSPTPPTTDAESQ